MREGFNAPRAWRWREPSYKEWRQPLRISWGVACSWQPARNRNSSPTILPMIQMWLEMYSCPETSILALALWSHNQRIQASRPGPLTYRIVMINGTTLSYQVCGNWLCSNSNLIQHAVELISRQPQFKWLDLSVLAPHSTSSHIPRHKSTNFPLGPLYWKKKKRIPRDLGGKDHALLQSPP